MNTKVNATIVKESEKAYQVTEVADWILNRWAKDQIEFKT